MKNIIIMLLLFSNSFAMACDICGGVGPNASIGVLASSQFHTIGINNTFRQFNNSMNGIVHTQTLVCQHDLAFRWQVNPRIQFHCMAPYTFIQRKDVFSSNLNQGLGDVQLLLNGTLLKQHDTTGSTTNFISIGAGLKLPTGAYNKGILMYQNLYPGTGSVDALLILNGFRKINKVLGLQMEGSYCRKGSNQTGYKYGNSQQLSISAIANKKLSTYRFLANFGINYDHFSASMMKNEALSVGQNNAGYQVQAKLGFYLLTYRFMWSMVAYQPVIQNLNNGQTTARNTIQFNVQYFIKNKS